MSDDMDENLFSLLDELRVMAQVGLRYADDPYNVERYERILALVSEWYGRSVSLPAEEVRERFAREVGYVTAKVSANAAVFDEAGRPLLQLRANDGFWGLPGGFTEPNESPRETAVRETKEETGLTVELTDLVGIYTRKPGQYGPHSTVIHLHSCVVTGGDLEASYESEALRYRRVEDVTEWHKNHECLALDAADYWTDST